MVIKYGSGPARENSTPNILITKWDTSIAGGTVSGIRMPFVNQTSNEYRFSIDWGDGTKESYSDRTQLPAIHTYDETGIYTIRVVGTILGWDNTNFSNQDDAKLIDILNWGPLTLKNAYSFYNSTNLTYISADDYPNFRFVINEGGAADGYEGAGTVGLFGYCSNLTGIKNLASWTPSQWDINGDMGSMFTNCTNFNQDISAWDTSNVTSMSSMFYNTDLFNVDLSSWDVSNVTDMSYMFFNAQGFDQDLSYWDFTSCTNFSRMLDGSNSDYSQVTGWTYGTSMRGLLSNLTSWDTSSWSNWHPSRTGVEDYFYFAGSNTTFNSSWITGWDMSNAKNLSQMFYYARAFNQPIGIWDTSNVTSISSTFYEADAFNQPLSGWDTSNVVDMGGTFRRCNIFNQDIGNWNTSNVTTMQQMFNYATVFNNNSSSSISGWDVSNVTNMYQMFDTASAFNQPIGSWDVSNCTTFNQMFRSATSFNQDLSSWNVSGVTDMSYMFYGTNFNNGGSTGINNWDTSSLTTMFGMFYDAITFNQPIGDWDTSSVQNIRFMFYNADAFDQDLSNWVVTGITTATSFMQNANGLSTTNYDRTLSGWSSQAVQNGINIHFGGSQYSTATGLAYRNALVSAGWTITDGGAA